MSGVSSYFRHHRSLCITQLALIALLAVVGFVWGRPWLFLPFLALTVLRWAWSGGRWLLYFWTGLLLAIGTYQAFQPQLLAQLEPGDYSLALSLALMLVFLLVTLGSDYQDKVKNTSGTPGRKLG